MAYNNVTALQDRIVAALKTADWSATISAQAGWATIATDSLANAYQFIATTLAGRGFSDGQIGDWDYGPAYELDLALFFALRDGGGLNNFDDRFIQKLDRRKELTGQDNTPMLTITNSGQPVRPLGDSPPVSVGYLSSERGSFYRSVGTDGTVTSHDW